MSLSTLYLWSFSIIVYQGHVDFCVNNRVHIEEVEDSRKSGSCLLVCPIMRPFVIKDTIYGVRV